MSHRPRSQQNQYESTNQLAQSASPNKGFKTRVVYKNAKVDETTNPMVSLYGQSFNKTPQKPASRGELSSVQSARISLADIGAMQRHYSSKTPNAKSKMDLLTSPKNERRPPSQSGSNDFTSPRTVSEQERARYKLN